MSETPETNLIPGDPRQPAAGHLNYGVGIDEPLPTTPFGPNTLGERLWPVTIQRLSDRTRIGFSYIAPSLELIGRSVLKYGRG